jgi:DNA-binding MarR family transcriptional regulator
LTVTGRAAPPVPPDTRESAARFGATEEALPESVGPAEAADELGCQLARLMRLMERATSQLAARRTDGLERAAYVLLAHLVREGPHRTTALAEAVRSDPSTVSRQVAGLVQHGLVERRPDPRDGRACLLAATAEGERVFDRHRQSWNAHLLRMLATWSPAEVRRLAGLLDRFNADFERFRVPPETT